MADIKPARLLTSPNRVGQFKTGDTVGIPHGGTGGSTPAQGRSNLGAASAADQLLHESDNNNPHVVTPQQIGAAEEVDLQSLITSLVNHILDVANPHQVTATQVGAIANTLLGSPNGAASLDASGQIPLSQIPSIAVTTVKVVANEAARLALVAQESDKAIQTDDGSHYVMDENNVWQELPSVNVTISQLSTTTSVNLNTLSGQTISFDPAIILNGSISNPSTSELLINDQSNNQVYNCSYSISSRSATNLRKSLRAVILVNGVEIIYTESFSYSRNLNYDGLTCSNSFALILQQNDVVELFVQRDGGSGSSNLTSAQLLLDKRL